MKAFREAWMQARRRKLILGIVLAGMLLIIFLFLPEEGSGFEKNFFSVLIVGVLGFWLGLEIGDRFLLYPLEGERDQRWREAVRECLTSDLTYEHSANEATLFLTEYPMHQEEALFILHWLRFDGGAPVDDDILYQRVKPFTFGGDFTTALKCLELVKDDVICFDKEKRCWRLSPRLEKFLYGRIFLRKRSWLPGDPLVLKSQ